MDASAFWLYKKNDSIFLSITIGIFYTCYLLSRDNTYIKKPIGGKRGRYANCMRLDVTSGHDKEN